MKSYLSQVDSEPLTSGTTTRSLDYLVGPMMHPIPQPKAGHDMWDGWGGRNSCSRGARSADLEASIVAAEPETNKRDSLQHCGIVITGKKVPRTLALQIHLPRQWVTITPSSRSQLVAHMAIGQAMKTQGRVMGMGGTQGPWYQWENTPREWHGAYLAATYQ